MQIREFQKQVTAKQLNESLAKKFGYTINFEQFTDIQLEDARNKLRTRLSQLELSESFDSILESPSYQKTRLMLDCINQEILEREQQLGESAKPDFGTYADGNKKEPMKKAATQMKKEKKTESYVANSIRQRAKGAVPESWINSALKRIELGEADTEELKAELKVRYDINESKASWMLLEGEEDKAETIMATKDMVDRITGWLEDVAAMKAEQLLELLDSIRETQGSDVAQSYQEAVKPALEAIYTSLETSRQGLSNALSIVSGGEAQPTMGAEMPGASAPTGLEGDLGAAGDEVGAGLGGAPELGSEVTPPAAEAGREKRESVDYSRRLGMLLASKKK